MSQPQQNGADTEAGGELSVYERHRAIVRETDKRFSSVHGYGGAAVLCTTGIVFALLVWATALTSAIPWVLSITVLLVSLFVLSSIRRKRRRQLRQSIEEYCEINEIDVSGLRNYYANDGIYPYFESLFVERERET